MRSGVGFYNGEPRNFSRGFDRGYPRPYQSSQPPPSPKPPRKGDLFVEAGKLAVEYLVSRGLLSSSVIPGNERSPNNDQDTIASSGNSRERKKYGDSRSSDWSRENGKVVSVPEKISSSQGIEVDDDKCRKDTSKEENSGFQISRSMESANIDGSQGDGERETMACHPLVDSGKVASSLDHKGDEELPMSVDEPKDEKDGSCFQEQDQKSYREESSIEHNKNNNDASAEEKANLTKVHCFLNDKNLKNQPLLISEEMNTSDTAHHFHDVVKQDNMSGPSEVTSLSEVSSPNCPGNSLSDHSFKDAGTLGRACGVDQLNTVDSLSFVDKEFSHEQKSCGLSDLRMSSSIQNDRKEKRSLEDDHMPDGAKKVKQWLSVAQSNEYLQHSNLNEKKPVSPEKRDASFFGKSADQENFHKVSLPMQVSFEAAMSGREEKQLLSSSYKICDLNLVEASDIHENRGVESLLYPSLSSQKKEAQIDIDLSMSNNCSFISEYSGSGSVRKPIEIIDLESTSMEEGDNPKFSAQSAEAGSANVETFSDNPQHTNDNPDGQDGYGLMISELLGNDVPNCAVVRPDMNSLQNDMGLHHGEGIFTEDDPIYMSLGEIPLSLLQGWEQPTQEKNPFDL
ncbi:hypothetical protein vseg_010940 [Gypsophila vaccaria]